MPVMVALASTRLVVKGFPKIPSKCLLTKKGKQWCESSPDRLDGARHKQ